MYTTLHNFSRSFEASQKKEADTTIKPYITLQPILTYYQTLLNLFQTLYKLQTTFANLYTTLQNLTNFIQRHKTLQISAKLNNTLHNFTQLHTTSQYLTTLTKSLHQNSQQFLHNFQFSFNNFTHLYKSWIFFEKKQALQT